MAKENEVAIIVKIPLDSGWLTGRYDENSKFDDIRSRWTNDDKKVRSELVNKVKKIIPDENKIVQTAIAFCLAFDAVSTVIPGNKNIKQLMSNLESTNEPISEELVKRLQSFYKEEVESLHLPW